MTVGIPTMLQFRCFPPNRALCARCEHDAKLSISYDGGSSSSSSSSKGTPSAMATAAVSPSSPNVGGKENASPNVVLPPSPSLASDAATSSKAQLISARLAEWKKRIGVAPGSARQNPPSPSPPSSLSTTSPSPLSTTQDAATQPPPHPKSPVRTQLRASAPGHRDGPGEPSPARAPPAIDETKAPATEKGEEEAQQQQQSTEQAPSALLVLDFSEPLSAAPRQGFQPGRNGQHLLAARAERKRQAEMQRTPLQATTAPIAAVAPSPTHSLAPRPISPAQHGEVDRPLAPATITDQQITVIDGTGKVIITAADPSSAGKGEDLGDNVYSGNSTTEANPECHGTCPINACSLPSIVLADVTDEAFDLDLSICGECAEPKSPEEDNPRQTTETTNIVTEAQRDGKALRPEGEDWEKRFHEEHLKFESLQTLLRDYERDLELVLCQHEAFEREQQRFVQTQVELQELKAELLAVTETFSDLKKRYDEVKLLNENLRKNEASLLATLHRAEEERADAEARFEALRAHAEEKLASAAAAVRQATAQTEQAQSAAEAALAEQTKLVAFWQARALIAEAKLPGLMQALSCKEEENKELLHICDQLMASLQPSASDDAGAPQNSSSHTSALLSSSSSSEEEATP